MAGLAQSMSGGGMGGLIPMAFKRRDDDSSGRPPPLAMGAIPAIASDLQRKKRPTAPTIASGGETSNY
jgi:hypothetical protein